jgi:RNA polymerase sigma-70 factor (ECF subfamily)
MLRGAVREVSEDEPDGAPGAPSDEPAVDLIAACQRGDREALAALFESFKDRVYSLALHLSGDPHEAGDVAQDVFLKLLTRLGQFRRDARFTTWLYRVVVNTFLDGRRARSRLVSLDDNPAPPWAVHPPGQERELLRAERARRVAAAVARLPAGQRAALVLRYGTGLSYEAIAETLGLSAGTVASRLSRALQGLARELESEDGP